MPTKVPIQSIVLTSTSSSITFLNIDQTYQELEIVVTATSDYTPTPDVDTFCLRFNGDTSNLYSNQSASGDASNSSSGRNASQTLMRLGQINANTITTAQPILLNVFGYSNSTTFKTVFTKGGTAGGKSNATVSLNTGLYRSTNPITSITLYCGSTNFTAGSTFHLYGISPVNAKITSAFGGTDIFYDSSYVYHVFKGSGVFIPNRALTADYLVVGGGGGSYTSSGGGGGAGGYRTSIGGSTLSLTAGTSYTVTVGAGGAANATSGTSSVFSTITSAGGGKGGTWVTAGAAGGSGGGGSYYQNGYTSGSVGGAGNTPSTSPSQGNSGGTGSGDNTGGSSYSGAGGGGATASGANATNSGAGAGGAGAYSTLTDALGAVSGLGELSSTHYYFAGGGGGGSDPSRTPNANGAGGVGGGGAGGTGSVNAVSGKTNTGGGAGGGTTNAASGGSGIVIVRYAR